MPFLEHAVISALFGAMPFETPQPKCQCRESVQHGLVEIQRCPQRHLRPAKCRDLVLLAFVRYQVRAKIANIAWAVDDIPPGNALASVTKKTDAKLHGKTRSLVSYPVLHYFLFLLSCVPNAASGAQIVGRVVGIADGDTLTLLDGANQQHRIRISGLDAPERNQPFGRRSKENLSRLAFGRSANADCSKQDRYQREVCTVFVDGLDVGLEQIRAGLAWWYRRYANEQPVAQRLAYEHAEAAARQQRTGLWRDAAPTPPWEYRHAQPSQGTGTED